ncbi:phenylacetyl ligase [Fusarium mundagurra]|uniref:Phenylacetyl ligase n=1 Tax=Fusarium mundagurra TaxID=1567541 RepID=A0A8H5Z374_9HYPO|nr:phenylacetyl ligase [Fusarium mundagurra]
MVFTPLTWVPELPIDPPDSIALCEFMTSEAYGRLPFAKRLDFSPNEGVEWDKVVSIFSVNTVDNSAVTQAVHRLNGIVTPASASHTVSDLTHQLRSSGVKALFTCVSRLDIAVKAAKTMGIPQDRIFILATPDNDSKLPFTTFDDLVKEGADLPELEQLKWVKGQGARQVAFLCYSSGTSGFPKAVMISHRNIIANVLQLKTYESVSRKKDGIKTQACLGALPFSHIYGLLIISFASTFRGDKIVVLPEFDLEKALIAVQTYKIAHMFVVGCHLRHTLQTLTAAGPTDHYPHHPQAMCSKYDLSSVRWPYGGAASLGPEVLKEVKRLYPKWRVGQGYGLTETCTVVCTMSEDDMDDGSSGSLGPSTKAMIIDIETGEEIRVQQARRTPSPDTVYGPGKDGRWIRTGDEVLIRLVPSGNEHLVIVDILKELIKVNGHQVAPAELGPTSFHTRTSQTETLSKYPTTRPAKCQKHT